MPISYKNKIYTMLGTPTALSGDAVSATDSSGVPAKDYTVKGTSIVWNQILQNPNFSNTMVDTRGYVDFMVQHLASPYEVFFNQNLQEPDLVSAVFTATASGECRIKHNGADFDIYFCDFSSVKNHKYYIYFNFTSTNPTVAGGVAYNKAQLFDLTQMFGSGNEPTTPEEFRAMFPDDYYTYNVGELKTIVPTRVEANGVERFQLLDKSKYPSTTTTNGVTFTNNGDGTITANGTATDRAIFFMYNQTNPVMIHGKGFIVGDPEFESAFINYDIYDSNRTWIADNASYDGKGEIFTMREGAVSCNVYIAIEAGATANNLVFKPQLFDLTRMFGVGNEPATPAEFWQRVPEKLYGYNPNDYKSVNIPSSKHFPDGMRSAGSAYDEINFLSQKAIKRIGAVDLGTLNWNYDSASPSHERFVASVDGIKLVSGSVKGNLVCPKYTTVSADDIYLHTTDKTIAVHNTIAQVWVYDTAYTDAVAFKVAMSGVMLYYELEAPVETAITPPLQALSTPKGFTSFSAPNSLTQNGPLSVTYYAEGGVSPEKGWLTSYKRKLYMGRNVEWNQLFDKNQFSNTKSEYGIDFTNNGDGTWTIVGTKNITQADNFYLTTVQLISDHKYFLTAGLPSDKNYKMELFQSPIQYDAWREGAIFTCAVSGEFKAYMDIYETNVEVVFKPQLFDLTQMFGAGNEPSTPEEFWSYFGHKLYPYNPGETQPLFKISRKSQWGAAPKHYTARWDKVNAAMVRLNDAASFPTDVTNFAHRGSVNANYSNPFDNIYPWSGIKLCNISIDLYRNLVTGDSITKCVTAWEGDANFSYNDVNGVWRYRPEFWGKSWEDNTYRYFDVTDQNVYGSNYVHYPEAIVGRWHGRKSTLTIGGAEKTCLVPSVGMPAKRIAMSTLHTYAKNYGATIDSIFSIDADVLLCIVEFATMNTQNAIGNGVTSVYRQSSDLIAEDATNSNVVKVLASAASAFCIPGAIFDIGTSNGGVQVGSYHVVSVQPNIGDAQYLDVTLNEAVTVTAANYWSVHGIINVADEEIGSKSGYIGTNGKCNSYYRGLVLFGNMFIYTLGAYENYKDKHIWIANSDEEADNYDALNTSVHYDTGLVLPSSGCYTKKLGMMSRSGLLSIPVFCTEIGVDSNNPTGDYFYNGVFNYNTVLIRGGGANGGSNAGALYGYWGVQASHSIWHCAARPRLKNP